MNRIAHAGLLVAGLALLGAASGCKPSQFEKDAIPTWRVEETIESNSGQCSYRLDAAWLGHEGDWAGGVTVTTKNETADDLRCAWEAVIVGPDGRSLSRRTGGGGGMAAGAEQVDAVDLSAIYRADGASRDAWLYIGTSEGWNMTSELGWQVANARSSRP